MILNEGLTDLGAAIDKDTSLALFAFLQHFPFSGVISLVAIVMVLVFFVTSADSGAMVVDMLASGRSTKHQSGKEYSGYPAWAWLQSHCCWPTV